MPDNFICSSSELKENQTKGFDVKVARKKIALFVIRREGHVFAYENKCPHTGAPLEWQLDQFLDFNDEFIQCSLHGALFKVNDGLCLRGPCLNESLTAIDIIENADGIYINDGKSRGVM